MAPSRHDWKIVDWDVKPQHNQPTLKSPQIGRNLGQVNDLRHEYNIRAREAILSRLSVIHIAYLLKTVS